MTTRYMRFSLYISLMQGIFSREGLAKDWLLRQLPCHQIISYSAQSFE